MILAIGTQIDYHHRCAMDAAQDALGHARQCGDLLIEAKGDCQHGEWLGWLQANCTLSARQTQRYIRLAKRWDELANASPMSHLTLTGALSALAEPVAPKLPTWLPTGNALASALANNHLIMVQESSGHPGFHWICCIGVESGEAVHTLRPVRADFAEEALPALMPAWAPVPSTFSWRYETAEADAILEFWGVAQ